MTDSSPPLGSGPTRQLAKRMMAPFERRLEFAVSRAVEQAMRTEAVAIQDALRADVATLVELTYELQRQIEDLTQEATHRDQSDQSDQP